MTEKEITAIVQPRIYSAPKVPLEDRVPLDTPFSAHIDVCSVCNFKCSFCFQADNKAMKEAGLKRGMMPVALFKKIVDDLREFPHQFKKVKIGNHGEPTLHPNLPEMIAYVKQSGVAEIVELFTNGSKLSPELNRAMVAAGLDRINISLEGLTDERYMQVAGAKVDMAGMTAHIADLFSNRAQLRIYVKIADQTSPLDPADGRTFVLSQEERDRFYDTFGNICDEIYIEKVVPQWAETQLDKQNRVEETGMYGQRIKRYKDICPFVFMYLHFNWDGSTSPCTLDWPKKVNIGNVDRMSARDIWEGAALRDLRIAMSRGQRDQINFCNHCSAPMVCVDEDLDPFKEKVLQALQATNEERAGPNPWIGEHAVRLIPIVKG
jgi:radical SAM protein with 4Fe4S-binding SPASM domain